MSTKNIAILLSVVVAGTATVLTGCGKSANKGAEATAAAEHSHEGWWCDEHGVPEEVCTLCHPNIARNFKSKGDWCEKHDRPNSQCFICHPEKQAEFAALYEAKYGKQPPKPADETEDKQESPEKTS
jgi:hypothetical protein